MKLYSPRAVSECKLRRFIIECRNRSIFEITPIAEERQEGDMVRVSWELSTCMPMAELNTIKSVWKRES